MSANVYPDTLTHTADQHWVVNPARSYIKSVPGKGRGVFAAHPLPPQTVVEISPVLLFSKQDYDDHGRHTLLDHYTFNWRDGRMALALGLGSMFNHAENPNVSFSVDRSRECIVYTSARAIQPDEELCIFYGRQLWFDPVDGPPRITSDPDETIDPWGGLADIQHHTEDDIASDQCTNMDDIVPETDLPFTWKKLALEKEEEILDDIQLVQAWVVDIPDQTHIAPMLKWLKQCGLDKDSLSHLKRIRRQGPLSTLLLDISPTPPPLPPSPTLPPAYPLPVPHHPARTPTSLALKNTYWPTVFCPKRKWAPEPWTRAQVRWACDAVEQLIRAARAHAQENTHELPVVAYVPVPSADDTDKRLSSALFGYDTRTAARHPLRHAALDIIRQIAAHRAESFPSTNEVKKENGNESGGSSGNKSESGVEKERETETEDTIVKTNGAQYLLTGLSLFITHEPCLMCTMALLHSRVKEVFYFVPMPKTGGCGGLACVPALKGVNHRFSIAIWKRDQGDWPSPLDDAIDV